jgi:hypothetical protein
LRLNKNYPNLIRGKFKNFSYNSDIQVPLNQKIVKVKHLALQDSSINYRLRLLKLFWLSATPLQRTQVLENFLCALAQGDSFQPHIKFLLDSGVFNNKCFQKVKLD